MDFKSKSRSLRSLDWVNGCCADFQMASAAYTAIFLATERHWNPGQIGLAIGAQNLATMAFRSLWFAKTLADFEINDIAALPPLFCYNS